MTTGNVENTKFGLATGYCVNRNKIMKIIEIHPDMSYKLSVGGRDVEVQEIGMEGLTMDTYSCIKTVLKTFKQCTI